MKKLFFLKSLLVLAVMAVGVSNMWAEDRETIYSETFGSPTSNTDMSKFNGFSSSLITPTSDSWKVGTGNACTLTGSSGSGNAYCGSASKDIIFNFGDKLADYTSVKISFNYMKGSGNGKANNVAMYISKDGGENYGSNLIPSNTGSAMTWYTVSDVVIADEYLSNLCIKFTNTAANTGRIDDIVITGVLAVEKYALTFSNPLGGTLSVTKSGVAVATGDTFAEGTVLDIVATPAANYDFTTWSAASGTFGSATSSSTTFTMPAEGVELTATFTAQSIVSDIELLSTTNGTISADKATANLGETVTLTATPNAGYVLSEWTVLDKNTDEVDVVITGMNTATFVMPATDVLVDATFIKQHTITYSVNGTTTTRQYVDGATVDFSAPVSGIPVGYIFIGWRDNELDATDTNPDDYVTSATASADATYYAVFALPASYTEESWEKTELSALTSTDVFVFANGSKAMKNDDGDSTEPGSSSITISGTKITSEVADNLKFNVTGNATDGYTFFKNGSTDHLYCNTTTDSGNNNCIRVGEGNSVDRKLWVLNNSGYLITKDTPTRYLSFYNSSSFRGYLNTDNNPFTPTFYKYIAPEVSSYSDFRSSLTPEVLTISAAGMNTVYYATAMEVTGGIAYYANDVNDGKVVFVEFDGNVIPANTGAVIKGDVGDEVTLTLTEDVSFSETNLLLGSVSDELVEAVDGYEFFVLSDGEDGFGFYYPVGFTTEEMFINSAHKAYLKVSSSLLDGNGAKGLGIEWESTGVSELIKMNDGKADKVYNLAGQRVEAMQEGIYIIGGKKVVR